MARERFKDCGRKQVMLKGVPLKKQSGMCVCVCAVSFIDVLSLSHTHISIGSVPEILF